MTTRRPLRSYLFAPGDNPRLLEKVVTAGADAVVLDLEDAVAPERKDAARGLVATALARASATGPVIYVRINGFQSGRWAEDLDAVVCPGLGGIRVAKIESRAEVEAIAAHLDGLEQARGIVAGSTVIVATIESARGVLHAEQIASAPRVQALSFGATDFMRDIAAPKSAGETETLYARSHLVIVSRALGLWPPIASVHPHIADDAGLRESSRAARRLGFFGRSCIHPRQVPLVHEAFAPTSDEVAEARAVVTAFEAAGASASGAIALGDGQFVDRAVVERARDVLALAKTLARPGHRETERS